jgi:thioredoxin 1
MLINISDITLDGFVQDGKTVLTFKTPTCGPCKLLTPVLEKLVGDDFEELSNVKFGVINAHDNPESLDKFSVNTVPTMIFLENGKEVSRNTGYKMGTDLKNLVLENFNMPQNEI